MDYAAFRLRCLIAAIFHAMADAAIIDARYADIFDFRRHVEFLRWRLMLSLL